MKEFITKFPDSYFIARMSFDFVPDYLEKLDLFLDKFIAAPKNIEIKLESQEVDSKGDKKRILMFTCFQGDQDLNIAGSISQDGVIIGINYPSFKSWKPLVLHAMKCSNRFFLEGKPQRLDYIDIKAMAKLRKDNVNHYKYLMDKLFMTRSPIHQLVTKEPYDLEIRSFFPIDENIIGKIMITSTLTRSDLDKINQDLDINKDNHIIFEFLCGMVHFDPKVKISNKMIEQFFDRVEAYMGQVFLKKFILKMS